MSLRRPLMALTVIGAMLLLPGAAIGAFPGANGTIAFSREGAPPAGGIYGVDPAGTQQFQITPDAVIGDVLPEPSYSADGERIVFSRSVGGSNTDLFVMDADGQNQVQLTDSPSEDGDPAFSPDGRQIVFSTRFGGGDLEIVLMDADGQNQVPLTNNTENDVTPSFSPDGTRIVFTRLFGGGTDADILAVDPSGLNETPLAAGPTFDRSPSFAPDGQQIAFARGTASAAEIYVMGPNGENPTPLTSNAVLDTAPAFSPDGQRIASTRRAGGDDADVFVMDASGGNEVPLAAGLMTADFGPDWQPLNPPVIDVTAGKQKSAKHVSVTVSAQGEDATATLDGSLKAPKPKAAASKKKTIELDGVTVQLEPGVPQTVQVPVAGKGKKLIKKSLKAGKKPKGTITVTATDDLGAAASDSTPVKYKKKK